jgi:hypothetical protein
MIESLGIGRSGLNSCKRVDKDTDSVGGNPQSIVLLTLRPTDTDPLARRGLQKERRDGRRPTKVVSIRLDNIQLTVGRGKVLYTNVELTKCGTRVDGTPISCRLRYRSRTSRQDEQDKKMLELLCEPRVSTIEAPTFQKGKSVAASVCRFAEILI